MNKLFVLTCLFFLGNWLLDVGHVVYFFGSRYLTNGLWNFSALSTYHIGWYVSIICFVILAFLYIKQQEIIKKLERELN